MPCNDEQTFVYVQTVGLSHARALCHLVCALQKERETQLQLAAALEEERLRGLAELERREVRMCRK